MVTSFKEACQTVQELHKAEDAELEANIQKLVVGVCLELNIFRLLFIHSWGKPWVLVDGHLEA